MIGTIKKISFVTSKMFANLYCRRDGIRITLSDEIDPKAICLKFGYVEKYIRLPMRIVQAYQLDEKFEVREYGKETYGIVAKLCDKNPPKPLPVQLKTEMPAPKREDAVSVKEKHYRSCGHVSLKKDDGLGTRILHEIHSGEANFIRLVPLTEAPDKILTLEQIQAEFGENMLLCPYDSIVYWYDGSDLQISHHKGGDWLPSVKIPAFFLRKWNYPLEGNVDCLKMGDGSMVMCPHRVIDAVSKKEIDPLTEKVHQVHVCEPCSQPTELQMVRDIVKCAEAIQAMFLEMKGRLDAQDAQIAELKNNLSK